MSPAATCRKNGWTVGTRLVGDDGYGPTTIEITAVGEHAILARPIGRDGSEGMWVLDSRDWREVK